MVHLHRNSQRLYQCKESLKQLLVAENGDLHGNLKLYCIVFLRLRKLFEHKCHDKCIVKTPVPRLGPFCWLPGYGRVPDARDYKACQSPHSEMVGRISLARDSNPGPFDPESDALTVRPLAISEAMLLKFSLSPH